MPLSETMRPVRMRRVAIVAGQADLRAALAAVADTGTVQLDSTSWAESSAGPAGRALRAAHATVDSPALSEWEPDLDELVRGGRLDLLAGEAQLETHAAQAVRRGEFAALTGWLAESALPDLTARLSRLGAAVVPLPSPPGVDPPTLLPEGGPWRGSFTELVTTYGTLPYRDVDPTLPAAAAYVFMFGMMFGDAGHGLLLLLVALWLRFRPPRRLLWAVRAWPFVLAAGFTSVGFGVLYGEFFGPTGVLPVLWVAPLEQPMTLLWASVAVGAVLLAAAYAAAVVNRWREGGPRLAVYASSGGAGLTVFVGLGALAAGLLLHGYVLIGVGVCVTAVGLALSGVGFYAASGGGAGGMAQAGVEVFDAILRLGSNLFSFARLAAFGLTHAALAGLVWHGTTGLADGGLPGTIAAVLVFVLGNAVAFALEALVAAIQALRLEFYELFSRMFTGFGEPFHPWRIPIWTDMEEDRS
ncbi:V-type ATPase 116kDa subunit family protein [Stackebrandtia nassauensis]|uniref:V-type ATPase 116 kDa subunit n=1 Tax=Stackebrandtia nassauensis (strain DSM 44728 / CIP 108903 / NRRL B-16338 / NBRC 102104 / LLR-40K-21) TaxID=446470 RepID=D3PVK8_STANL|nr:V-type ATPase 116kDa subunit family protein [Stackebrandtia nassauensis]ADD43122.1 V-type ATPase 116 kDa subunit [Stackebrandtia nassauensis DSM 44728]